MVPAVRAPEDRLLAQVRELGRPLATPRDLTAVVEAVGDSRFVCLGEASHGTHEYYGWRAELSRRLVPQGIALHLLSKSSRNRARQKITRKAAGLPARLAVTHSLRASDRRAVARRCWPKVLAV